MQLALILYFFSDGKITVTLFPKKTEETGCLNFVPVARKIVRCMSKRA